LPVTRGVALLFSGVFQRLGLLVDDGAHVADALGAFGPAAGVAEHMGGTCRALFDRLVDVAFPNAIAVADIQSALAPFCPMVFM
jgi:hypothetical protein